MEDLVDRLTWAWELTVWPPAEWVLSPPATGDLGSRFLIHLLPFLVASIASQLNHTIPSYG